MLFLLRSFFFQNENLFSVFFCKDLDGLQLLRLLKLLNSPAPGNEDWWMDCGWTVHKRSLDFHELLCPEKHLELFFFGL